MEAPRNRFLLLTGGRSPGAPAVRSRARGKLRVIQGGHTAELELALADAIEAARQMRLEIEQRIASALDAFEDRR